MSVAAAVGRGERALFKPRCGGMAAVELGCLPAGVHLVGGVGVGRVAASGLLGVR